MAEGRHLFVSAFARKGMDECKQCEFGGWESDTLSDTNRDASASSVGGRALLSRVRVPCSVATLELPCEFVSAEQTPTLHGINSKHHTACYFTCAHVYDPSNSGSNSMA